MDAALFEFLFNTFLFIGLIVVLKDRKNVKRLLIEITKLNDLVNLQNDKIRKLELSAILAAKDRDEPKPTKNTEGLVDNTPAQPTPAAMSFELPPAIEKSQQHEATQTNPWANNDRSNQAAVQSPATDAARPSTPGQTTKQQTNMDNDASGFSIDTLLSGNGLFWLGAIILAFGGIFLAKYSIEAGLLPPSIRVIMGSLFGISLIGLAEYIDRNKAKFHITSPIISAAIASGGFITCFAMTLVSFDFYHFIPANIAFVILAIISLAAAGLALRFGPILAGIGVIGAYAVPALVSTGSNNVAALLAYIGFVSLSALWVAETVKQKWLWWQSSVGHFSWFVVAVLMAKNSDFWPVVLFSVVTLYLYVLATILGWKLQHTLYQALTIKQLLMPRREQLVVVLTTLLVSVFLALHAKSDFIIWTNIVVVSVFFVAASRHSALDTWPYFGLFIAFISFSLWPKGINFDDNLFPFSGRFLYVQIAVLVGMLFCGYMIKRHPKRHSYLLLLVVTPLALFGISYIAAPSAAESVLYPLWAAELLIIGAISSLVATKVVSTLHKLTYLTLTNMVITLCFTMLLEASTLTLAIASQIATMSYLSWKYQVKIPDWLSKVALLIVTTRLTFAPWLANYKDETILNIHWTIVIYPLILGLVWFTAKYNQSLRLKPWLHGVFIHIVALLLTTETSYFLIGDYPNFSNLSFVESTVLAFNWLILAGVYRWRATISNTPINTESSRDEPAIEPGNRLSKLYVIAATALYFGVTLLHLDISVLNNPFVENQYVGSFTANWLIVLWALPAGLLFSYYKLGLISESYKTAIFVIMGICAFMFVNGEIRIVFNQGYLYLQQPFAQAEVYTYSIVWLVLSTIMIFVAQTKQRLTLRNVGFSCLALVILKAFLIDMSHLQGLYRALSFIGLGLSLVAIGWLFQKLKPVNAGVNGSETET